MLLSIFLDDNMTWKSHISLLAIASKLCQSIAIIHISVLIYEPSKKFLPLGAEYFFLYIGRSVSTDCSSLQDRYRLPPSSFTKG